MWYSLNGGPPRQQGGPIIPLYLIPCLTPHRKFPNLFPFQALTPSLPFSLVKDLTSAEKNWDIQYEFPLLLFSSSQNSLVSSPNSLLPSLSLWKIHFSSPCQGQPFFMFNWSPTLLAFTAECDLNNLSQILSFPTNWFLSYCLQTCSSLSYP